MDIGRAIRDLMLFREVKPAQMCKDLDLDAGYVSMLTHSKVKDMKLGRAVMIARYLDIPIDHLVKIAESYPTPKTKTSYSVVKLDEDGDSDA